MARWRQDGEGGRGGLRLAAGVLRWIVLLATVLTAVTVLTADPSQAWPAPPVTQSPTPIVSKLFAVASPVVTFTITDTSCCLPASGHCHGVACASSACPAGLAVADCMLARDFASHIDSPPPQVPLTSTEPGVQFRPPRSL